MSVPARDQSYCETGQHMHCTGYTEDESDPESCMCPCHDPRQQSIYDALEAMTE